MILSQVRIKCALHICVFVVLYFDVYMKKTVQEKRKHLQWGNGFLTDYSATVGWILMIF